jgi:hypothetical protein
MFESGDLLRPGASFSQELAAVPPGRKRLGCLVIAAAVLLGSSVLLLFFFSSLYMSNPGAMQEALIEALSANVSRGLDSEAVDRAEEVDRAFRALSAANEAGNVGWRELWEVIRAYAEASADGAIDSEEISTLIERIRQAATRATSPRRL